MRFLQLLFVVQNTINTFKYIFGWLCYLEKYLYNDLLLKRDLLITKNYMNFTVRTHRQINVNLKFNKLLNFKILKFKDLIEFHQYLWGQDLILGIVTHYIKIKLYSK